MAKQQRNTLIALISVILLSTGIITALSVPFGVFPPLGELLFPGNGLWNIDEEIASEEVISSDLLSNDVTVLRDTLGIPHIYGFGEEDIAFATGYVHAQDRLFQMDLARRATRGQLSEVLGPALLEADQFALNKLMDYWTNETIIEFESSVDPVDIAFRDILYSYCDGINHYIENTKTLPLEFQFLNYKPAFWAPFDTFAFIKYMAEMLTWSYNDFTTIVIQDAIGEAAYEELFGSPRPYQIPITPDYGDFDDIILPEVGSTSTQFSAIDQVFSELSKIVIDNINQIDKEKDFIGYRDFIGSNNWAVSGDKTASGKPLLANDMHLSFNIPGIWYEAHLVDITPGADFNVYGFFLAGVPLPLVGHNNYVGWGYTNTGCDVIDWYFYESVNSTHYWYKGTPTEYDYINYAINVKGQDPFDFVIKTTVHGPIFEGMIDPIEMPDYANKVIACKWIAQDITYEARAIYLFSQAENRADFNIASEIFTAPAQNMIYADVHGNIGIRPTGKVPIRDDSNIPGWHGGNGSMLYNGSAGHGEWVSFVPFEDMPHSENPVQGYLTSSNQIIAGPEFLKNYSLQESLYLADGYRARRINSVLANGDDITNADMQTLQLDFYSVRAGNFTSYLLDVLNSITTKTTLQEEVIDLLVDWNYCMDKDGAAPSIFNVWLEIFSKETFNDQLTDFGCPVLPDSPTLEWYTKNNETSDWFDDKNTPIIETRDDMILRAIDITLTELEEFFGTANTTYWTWGSLHLVNFPHITGLEPLGYGPIPADGTSFTVCPFSASQIYRDGEIRPTIRSFGASERMILDFSNLSNSISIIPSGQRGISSSIHYIDQLFMYLNGEYHSQHFGADTIEKFQDVWIESTLVIKAGGA